MPCARLGLDDLGTAASLDGVPGASLPGTVPGLRLTPGACCPGTHPLYRFSVGGCQGRDVTGTMSMRHRTVRIASFVLLTALAPTATSAPMAVAASSTTCRVRNVTQDVQGHSFKKMVAAAHDGDRLRVRGTCTSADVVIDKDLTITGFAHNAILTGRDRHRVLKINAGATVTLRKLRIAHGRVSYNSGYGGAGIFNRGTLTLVDSIVQRNHTVVGVGISNDTGGVLRLIDSVVRRNSSCSGCSSAGIDNYHGTVTLIRSVVTRNTSGGSMGGISNSGTMTLTDSSVRHNKAPGSYGGIWNRGPLTLVDSDVRHNSAHQAAGIFNGEQGTVTLRRSVVGFNVTTGRGGGIFNWGTLTLVDSIVNGNKATGDGGGIANGWGGGDPGTIDLVRSAITGNTTAGQGGGIHNEGGGTITLDGTSSVTGNAPDDCIGTPAC